MESLARWSASDFPTISVPSLLSLHVLPPFAVFATFCVDIFSSCDACIAANALSPSPDLEDDFCTWLNFFFLPASTDALGSVHTLLAS